MVQDVAAQMHMMAGLIVISMVMAQDTAVMMMHMMRRIGSIDGNRI